MNMVEKFEAVKTLLNGGVVENFSVADAVAFLDGRIELVQKKNASGGGKRKPTAQQIANEGVKETILAVLGAATEPMTINAMCKANAELAEISNQRITALLTQLVDKGNGVVVRTEVKGKAHFALRSAD